MENKDTLSDIANGWLNVLTGKNRELALRRMDICNSCKFYHKETSICRYCGCPMVSKATLDMKVCPLRKW